MPPQPGDCILAFAHTCALQLLDRVTIDVDAKAALVTAWLHAWRGRSRGCNPRGSRSRIALAGRARARARGSCSWSVPALAPARILLADRARARGSCSRIAFALVRGSCLRIALAVVLALVRMRSNRRRENEPFDGSRASTEKYVSIENDVGAIFDGDLCSQRPRMAQRALALRLVPLDRARLRRVNEDVCWVAGTLDAHLCYASAPEYFTLALRFPGIKS